MRIHIIHQSATGNTLLGVQAMAAEFEAAGHECQTARVLDADAGQLRDADMIGIATAVYGFRPARNVLKFMNDMPALEGKSAFVLCCCSGWPSNSVRTLWRRLERKGLRVLGGYVLQGEDSWPMLRLGPLTPGRGCPSPAGLDAVRSFARTIMERAVEANAELPRAPMWKPDPLHFVGLAATWQMLRRGMLGKRVDADKCTACGKCAESCPTGAITLDGIPKFSRACMGCFACINLCPESAISCPMSWGRKLYRGPGSAT